MANFTALKTAINNAIKTNGNEEITGAILQAILDAMVETLGDSAIGDLENAITTEVTNRENAVGDVAADLAAEALARANKDNQLDNRINAEEYNRQNADAALSRTVDQGFQTLNSQMTALNAAISALNAAYQNGYLYGGIATPSSSPSNNKCFYIALQGGTYTNFGGVGVVEGINIIKNDSGWKVEHIYDQTTLLNEFYLLRQQVIRAISSIDPIVIQGDVTNAPDEEDLTSDAQHLLKFKDRAYSPLNFSGLGMKILRKNIAPLSDSAAFNGFVEGVTAEETLAGTPELIFWDRMNTRFIGIKDGIYYAAWTDDDNYVPVSTSLVYMYNGIPYQWTGSDFIVDETEVPNLVNCLTQDMINEANTIYIIRYDYTLKEDINIPANCVLQFDGGSLNTNYDIHLSENDTILGNNCSITINATLYGNVFTKISDLNIIRTVPLLDNESVVLFDDTYFPLTDSYGRGTANIDAILKNCKLILPVGIADEDVKGNAIEAVSRGLLQYGGYWGLTFDNVFIDGIAEKAFYMWCVDGWMTDLLFTRCMVNGSKVGWSFAGNETMQQISLTNCSMQHVSRSTYGIECDKVLWMHLTGCIFWDWHESPYSRYNFTENTRYVFMDWAEGEKPYSINGDPKKVNRTVFVTNSMGNHQLGNFIDFSQNDIKLIDWYNIPDGTYFVSGNASHGSKIGVMSNQGGTLLVGKGENAKCYIYISNSQDSIPNRAEVKFMSLLEPPSDDISLTQTASSLWRRALIGTDTNKGNIKIYDTILKADKYIECKSFDSAEAENFPQVSSRNVCKLFFNTTYYQPAIQTIDSWEAIQLRPFTLKRSDRPDYVNSSRHNGLYIVDSGLSPNKPIWWLGDKWIESDGATAGVKRCSTTTNRPNGSDIYEGFMYFDTTLGKPIYAKAIANDNTVTWVDATGATV